MHEANIPECVPGGVFVAGAGKYPERFSLVADEGHGAYLQTEDGEEYLDYLLGGGPLVVGHAHPSVVKAVRDQATDGSTFYLSSRPGYDLAEKIVSAIPSAEALKFTSSGSEATYFALRLARAHTGRTRVLKFEGAYHGWHDSVLRSSSYADSAALEATSYPDGTRDSAGTVPQTAAQTLVAPYNDLEETSDIVRSHADELAAIIVEPLMRSLSPEDGFLAGLRDLCDTHDVALIFDEVVTGFRLAWGGGQEYYGVEPDLTTLGKAIGGGTPVGAVCGREEIMRHADPGIPTAEGGAYVSGTLNGNPLCARAGLATLDLLDDPGTYDGLFAYADEFRALITDVLADSPLNGHALGEGPIVDYAITDASEIMTWRDLVAADGERKAAIDEALLDRNVLQLHGSKRYISTAHGDDELERTAEAFKGAVEHVTQNR